MKGVYETAKSHDVPVHTDGARLFHAAVALGVPAARIAANTDTVCFCVSKALSAPVGSILCGPAPFVARARAFRRMLGGNMRQAGVLAAAGIVALDEMVERLAEDHATARRLAEGLHRIDASLVDPASVETNIVPVELRASGRRAAEWAADLKEAGVWVAPSGPWTLRFVTHRHIAPSDVDATLAAFRRLWSGRAVAA
jgi:threonine aldolase